MEFRKRWLRFVGVLPVVGFCRKKVNDGETPFPFVGGNLHATKCVKKSLISLLPT